MDTENHNFLLASCCNVDVVNGAVDDFFPGFVWVSATESTAVLHSCKKVFAFSCVGNAFAVVDLIGHALCSKNASILYDDLLSNACISLSFSAINLTATDCTLHAESHVFIFCQRIGESSNHTKRSNSLLACCALTKSVFNSLGSLTALVIASLVIS